MDPRYREREREAVCDSFSTTTIVRRIIRDQKLDLEIRSIVRSELDDDASRESRFTSILYLCNVART